MAWTQSMIEKPWPARCYAWIVSSISCTQLAPLDRSETFVNCRVMVPHSSQPCPAVAHTTHNQINVLRDVSGPPPIASQILIPLRLPQNRLPQKIFLYVR